MTRLRSAWGRPHPTWAGLYEYLYGAAIREDVDAGAALAAYQRAPLFAVLPYLEWWGPLGEPPDWAGHAPSGRPWLLFRHLGFPGPVPAHAWCFGARFDADGWLTSARGCRGAPP